MQIIGINSSQVRTSSEDPEFRLGSRGGFDDKDNGYKEYMYVQVDEAVGAEDIVVINPADWGAALVDTTSTAAAAGAGFPLGVAEVAIASGGYGWVQIYGKCTFSAITSNALATLLGTSATAGAADDGAGTGDERFEGLIGTAAESGGSQAGFANYPYVGATL